MAKKNRSYSPYAADAVALLGANIRTARIERRWSEQELADRARINRITLRKIEKGDKGVGIGYVFEVATILGITLFHPERDQVRDQLRRAEEKLALLPRQVHSARRGVKDDF